MTVAATQLLSLICLGRCIACIRASLQYAEAVTDAETALKHNPKSTKALYRKGYALERLVKLDAARYAPIATSPPIDCQLIRFICHSSCRFAPCSIVPSVLHTPQGWSWTANRRNSIKHWSAPRSSRAKRSRVCQRSLPLRSSIRSAKRSSMFSRAGTVRFGSG